MLTLNHCGALAIKDGKVLVKQSINKHTTFFSQMFEPFLLGYWVSFALYLAVGAFIEGEPCISPGVLSLSQLPDNYMIVKVKLLYFFRCCVNISAH